MKQIKQILQINKMLLQYRKAVAKYCLGGNIKAKQLRKDLKNENIDPQYVCHKGQVQTVGGIKHHLIVIPCPISVTIMAKNKIEPTVKYSFPCGVRGFHGFHVFTEVWKPILRERLNLSHARKNLHDRYAIAAYKRLPGKLAD